MLYNNKFLLISVFLAHFAIASSMDSDTYKNSITLPYLTLEGHTDIVNAITSLQTRDGRLFLASGGYDENIRIWNLSDDNFPCVFTQDAQGIQHKQGVCQSICLTEIDRGIQLIWGYQNVSDQGFVYSTVVSDGPRPWIEYGPYKHAPFQIIEKAPGIVLWSCENNQLHYYDAINVTHEAATHDGEYIHGICILDSFRILKRMLSRPSKFYAQINNFLGDRLYKKLFDSGSYRFEMFMMNDDEFVVTNPNGFTVWNIKNDHHAERTVKINLPFVMFDNCCRYSDDTLIVYPGNVQQSGFYLISYADGSVIQHITSDVLNQKDIFPNKLLVTDKFIIYTVVDRNPERSNKDLETKIFVSKKPN